MKSETKIMGQRHENQNSKLVYIHYTAKNIIQLICHIIIQLHKKYDA